MLPWLLFNTFPPGSAVIKIFSVGHNYRAYRVFKPHNLRDMERVKRNKYPVPSLSDYHDQGYALAFVLLVCIP